MIYNPHRMADKRIGQSMVELAGQYAKKLPVEVLSSHGYLITMFETEQALVVHFLAEDYDTDIDHKLDEMRFHRSRVNYVNKVEPIGVDRVVTVRSEKELTVYTPFNEEETDVCLQEGVYKITLPEKTSYAIMKFMK